MNFEWFVSLRYLKAKRKQTFISLISFISVAGVAIGVMALIIVLAVMTGFTSELRNKILGLNSHIIIQRAGGLIYDSNEIMDELRTIPGIDSQTPYIYSQTMITGADNGTGAILRGIDPESAGKVLQLEKYLKSGRLEDLKSPGSDDDRSVPGIILGDDLARQLRVYQGDKIRLLSASGPLTPIGIIPKMKTCQVIGIFKTDMYEYDSSLAYVSLHTAQEFLDIGNAVHGIELKLDDIYKAGKISKMIDNRLGLPYLTKSWMTMNKNLFSALKLEKTALSVIVALVVLVAAFNIISTLIMVVMEKNRDIAILKSMGASSSQIMKIFIYEGLVIGIAGTILGILGGLGACEILGRYQFIKLPDVYPLSTLPVLVLFDDVLLISISAILITFLATLYPSWQAAQVEPAKALRYE